MKYIEPENYEEMLRYIELTFSRAESGELLVADGASNVVGATLANGSVDIHALYVSHPGLEELVELCADTETYDDAKKQLHDPTIPDYVTSQWKDIHTCFKALRARTNTPD